MHIPRERLRARVRERIGESVRARARERVPEREKQEVVVVVEAHVLFRLTCMPFLCVRVAWHKVWRILTLSGW
jgi:hypothetical protein